MRRVVIGSLVLGGLGALVLGADAQEARPPEPQHRYELVGERREPAILDRHTGRLFVFERMSADARAILCIDPAAGTLVTRPLTVKKETTPAGAGEVPWPTRDEGGSPRFVARTGGRELMLFDAATGRLYVIEPPEKLVVIDPIEAVWVERPFRVTDKTGSMQLARRSGNEAAAIGALKTINVSQTLFREGDKENDGTLDYGTLAELSQTTLIDGVLGSGRKQGYVFEAAPAPETPEFLWMAVANPEKPGVTGERYFATNHAGVIYYRNDRPFTLTPDCAMPPDALPVGR